MIGTMQFRRAAGGMAAGVLAVALLSACTTATTVAWTPSGASHATGTPLTGSSAVRHAATGTKPVVLGSAGALAAMLRLPERPAVTMAGYSRTQYGEAWTDDTADVDGHNGCDTRDDILRRDLHPAVVEVGGCVVSSGILADAYTGAVIHFVRGPESGLVQIDHVVALGDAWTSGAQALSLTQRTELANDPLELLAVSGSANDAKGDADAAGWLPRAAYDCSYVARQVAVKTKYRLWITAAERAVMGRVLAGCPTQTLPAATATSLAAVVVVRSTPTVVRTTPRPPVAATHAPPTVVHPGAFCAPVGATGVTDKGTAMVCGTTPNSPSRNRWHEP